MTDKEYRNHMKEAQNHRTIIHRRQEPFNRQNDQFIRSVLSGLDTTYMSNSIIAAIEEHTLVQHYHKLRLLAAEQNKFFNI